MKFVIVGDPGVGKTSILFRFANDSFNSSYVPTIGIDYRVKSFSRKGKYIKLHIWDISGRPKFLDYVSSHFHGAMGIIFVYDITNEESFNNIAYWMQFVNEVSDPNIEKIFIGNKCDMEQHRRISKMQGANCAKENHAMFWETSALWDLNIDHALVTLAQENLSGSPIETLPLSVTECTNPGKMRGI